MIELLETTYFLGRKVDSHVVPVGTIIDLDGDFEYSDPRNNRWSEYLVLAKGVLRPTGHVLEYDRMARVYGEPITGRAIIDAQLVRRSHFGVVETRYSPR